MKYKAFTLTETLLAIVVIGVVAILVIPNFLAGYEKKIFISKLQKSYIGLQQLLDYALADSQGMYLYDTNLIQSINGNSLNENDQSGFISTLGVYLKITKVCPAGDFSAECHDIYYQELNENENLDEERGYSNLGTNLGGYLQIHTFDGSIYYFGPFFKAPTYLSNEECQEIKNDGGKICSWHGDVTIDVNGTDEPNIYGRDLFRFVVSSDGKVYPYGSTDQLGSSRNWASENSSVCDKNSAYGFGCASRIIDEGWKMDY